ncbi:uncharacterized protein LOC6584350 [Drosophila mojavensis]|uniref:Uncharacterized protein n=1 Tax=Drosophila mojavensis TaxID=7230 RepID=B4L445_DROMO|nr:uncharacterized protein LOC6584350 [Drosophila mojavensis]EDW07323.1 uncharacterized protein Dmoj_GI14931 [Drosophila mojavensis]
MRRLFNIFGLLLLLSLLGRLHAAPVGEHVDYAGCIRVTIIKRPLTTPTTTTTTTTAAATTAPAVPPG